MSDSTLRLLGPVVGWENAERLLAGGTILLTGLLFFFLARTALNSVMAAAISAWLAGNWFFWMGFYDFSLSLGVFAGLVLALRSDPRRIRWLWVAILFLALYATHLFCFAAATALLIWLLLWRVARRESRPAALMIPALPIAVLVYELFDGPVGSGGISWLGWPAFERAFIGWGIGDFLISLTWIGLATGIALMLSTWAGMLARLRDSFRSRQWNPIDIFALCAFVASLAVPDHIATGLYTAARIRFIAVILLVPSTAAFLSKLRVTSEWRGYAVSIALLLGLALQGAFIVRTSHAVTAQVAAMEQSLRDAGVKPGDWVTAPIFNRERPIVRINAFKHAPERAYLRVGASALDDYEASLGNFEVQWRQPPDKLNLGLAGSTWYLSREPRVQRWDGGLWILHDANFNLMSKDPSLIIYPDPSGSSAAEKRFKVSSVHLK